MTILSTPARLILLIALSLFLFAPIGFAANVPDIIINEIIPSPEGPDKENEWIEIFNQSNFEAEIGKWQITDTMGSTKIYTFPEKTVIEPKEYLVISRPTSKITLNNDGDGLRLSNSIGTIIDSVNYEKALLGKSFNRINDDWDWSSELTPGQKNIIPLEIENDEEEIKQEVAAAEDFSAIEKQTPEKNSFLSVLIIALTVAIFSGTIILLLKKYINSLVRN